VKGAVSEIKAAKREVVVKDNCEQVRIYRDEELIAEHRRLEADHGNEGTRELKRRVAPAREPIASRG